MDPAARQTLSLVSGPPLREEPGLGALTLPGFLREVTLAYADREALAFPTADGLVRWTYAELWERTVEVARALRACGVSKGSRVGVLMTNRPEWITAVFGAAMAGGVAVTLSTFSTPAELDHLLRVSGVSVLLFEPQVLKTDFAAVLGELGVTESPVRSVSYPFLRHVVALGEAWDAFLARGADEARELVEAGA